jgi:branched-chain amino acid transport system ATP-binding protein
MDVILSTVRVSKYFGALAALKAVDMEVKKGQIHGLIGPNGAGKTTLLNVISGLLPASEGKIFFDGKDITGIKPNYVVKMGLFRTFQSAQIFPKMTCLQNVALGRHHRIKTGLLQTAFRPPFIKSTEENETKQRSLEILEMVGLKNTAERWVTDLTWSECQLLQIARALISEPKLIILDEPSAGMGPDESQNMGKIIRQVCDEGITVILIAHDMKLVMNITDWITVLNFGEKICEGPPKQIQKNPNVLEAYLGPEE